MPGKRWNRRQRKAFKMAQRALDRESVFMVEPAPIAMALNDVEQQLLDNIFAPIPMIFQAKPERRVIDGGTVMPTMIMGQGGVPIGAAAVTSGGQLTFWSQGEYSTALEQPQMVAAWPNGVTTMPGQLTSIATGQSIAPGQPIRYLNYPNTVESTAPAPQQWDWKTRESSIVVTPAQYEQLQSIFAEPSSKAPETCLHRGTYLRANEDGDGVVEVVKHCNDCNTEQWRRYLAPERPGLVHAGRMLEDD